MLKLIAGKAQNGRIPKTRHSSTGKASFRTGKEGTLFRVELQNQSIGKHTRTLVPAGRPASSTSSWIVQVGLWLAASFPSSARRR